MTWKVTKHSLQWKKWHTHTHTQTHTHTHTLTALVLWAEGRSLTSPAAHWPDLCSDEWCHTASEMHLTASVNTFMNICLHSCLFIYIYKIDLNIFVAWGPFRYQDQKPSITIIHRCFTLGIKLCRADVKLQWLTSLSMWGCISSMSLWISLSSSSHWKQRTGNIKTNTHTQACL